MPESGLPIRVYKEHDMWHVDYGEGETEDHTSREEADAAADAVAQAEERTVVVEEKRPRRHVRASRPMVASSAPGSSGSSSRAISGVPEPLERRQVPCRVRKLDFTRNPGSWMTGMWVKAVASYPIVLRSYEPAADFHERLRRIFAVLRLPPVQE